MTRQEKNLYTAVDVGSTKVCTLVAQVTRWGEIDVLASSTVLSSGIFKGMVVNVQETEEAVRTSTEEARKSLGAPLPPAYLGVTSALLTCSNATSSLSRDKGEDRCISQQEVNEVLQASYPQERSPQEALYVIPQEYRINGHNGVRNPVGLKGQHLEVRSHVVVAQTPAIEVIIRALRRGGVRVRSLVLDPLASAEAVLTGHERHLGVVLVDIGGSTTSLALFQEGRVWHTTLLPVGGYHQTNDISIALEIPFAVAEKAKVKHGLADPGRVGPTEEVDLSDLNGGAPWMLQRQKMCHLLYDRIIEVAQLISYKMKQAGVDRMPQMGVVFTGGPTKLPGFEALMAGVLRTPVRVGNPGITGGIPLALQDPAYATSVGTLLWGIRHGDTHVAFPNGTNTTAVHKRIATWLSQVSPIRVLRN